MKKLLIYSPSSDIWGGGQIYIDQLCSYLNRNGIDAVIVSSEPDTFDAPAMQMPQVTSRLRRLSSAATLARRLKSEGFTHVLLNDLASVWLAPIFRLVGLNVSALLHLYLQKRSENELGHSSLEYHTIRLASRSCNRIFSVNKDNVAVIGKHVQFVGNFVPEWFFAQPSDESAEKPYDFIFVGRLAAEKNLPLFLRLLRNLIDAQKQEFSALLVGEGELETTVRDEIRSLRLEDYVTLVPWVDRRDLPRVYDQGKVFVVSSHHEGFATTLLEAHARGLPAIVTRSSGFCAEYLEDYGRATGLVFQPADVQSPEFLKKLAELIERHGEYAECCTTKARVFNEDNVLGPIADYLCEGE